MWGVNTTGVGGRLPRRALGSGDRATVQCLSEMTFVPQSFGQRLEIHFIPPNTRPSSYLLQPRSPPLALLYSYPRTLLLSGRRSDSNWRPVEFLFSLPRTPPNDSSKQPQSTSWSPLAIRTLSNELSNPHHASDTQCEGAVALSNSCTQL